MRHQCFGELARSLLQLFGELERNVARHITVRCVARPLQLDLRIRDAEGLQNALEFNAQLIGAGNQDSELLLGFVVLGLDSVPFAPSFFAPVSSFLAPSSEAFFSPARL